MATILLADDKQIFRRGIRLLLEEEEDLRVVGEAGDGHEAIELARKLVPDLVVMDINMPNLDGIEATRVIISEFPKMKVMALSVHSGKSKVESMLHAGAGGYILKESVPEELVDGVRAVLRGEMYLGASITGIVVSQLSGVLSRVQGSRGSARLNKSERDLIQLIAEGRSMEHIALRLQDDEASVWSTRQRLVEKLGLSNVAELTEYAVAQKWFVGPGGIEGALHQARDSDKSMRVATARKSRVGTDSTLLTKLHAPPATSDRVLRTALLERLEQRRGLPLTVVSAPAGCGKSTLVSQWNNSLASPSTWVSLDEDDNDPLRFMTNLTAAVGRIFPRAVLGTQSLLSAPALPPLSVLCGQFLSDLAQIDDAFVLVLDDYHRINAEAVHELVNGILEHPPKYMHLVLLSRTDPPLPLVRLRERGQVDEISGAELRFTREETSAFLHNTLSEIISEKSVGKVDEAIEGWAVGLRLLVSAAGTQEKLDHLLARIKTAGGSVSEYLVSEVLSRQPPNVVDSLCKMAILDRFCATLCDALRGPHLEPESGQLVCVGFIQRLQEHNLFLIPLDDEDRWFRFHHLFQQLLQARLERSHTADEIAALHSRASEWFETEGLIDEALGHALKAGDVPSAVRLVEKNRDELLNTEQWQRLERWLELLPQEAVLTNGRLMCTQVYNHDYHGRVAECFRALDQAEALLPTLEPASPEWQATRGEVDTFRSLQAFLSGEGESAIEYAERALRLVPLQALHPRTFARGFLALAHQMIGDSSRGAGILHSALAEGAAPSVFVEARTMSFLSGLHMMEGALAEVHRSALRSYQLGSEFRLPESLCFGRYFLGVTHYLRNQLPEAERYLTEMIDRRFEARDRYVFQAGFVLQNLYLSQGRAADASRLRDLMVTYVANSSDAALKGAARAADVDLAVRRGSIVEARRLCSGANFEPIPPVWLVYVPQLTPARLLLAEKTPRSLEKAGASLDQLDEFLRKNHRKTIRVDTLALHALVLDAQGDEPASLDKLTEALALAERGGNIRGFVDLGTPMYDLLERAMKRGAHGDHVRQVMGAFRAEARGHKI